ncbi:hypothetical protein ACFX1Q_007040 [Malus domestica]
MAENGGLIALWRLVCALNGFCCRDGGGCCGFSFTHLPSPLNIIMEGMSCVTTGQGEGRSVQSWLDACGSGLRKD